MKLHSFFKLTELQTKVASMLPFLLGSLYAFYRFNSLRISNGLLLLVSLLAIDLATTAINNFVDYKKARRRHGFGYERYNAIVRDALSETAVLTTISVLLVIAMATGFVLFLRTDLLVLAIGALSFAVGVFYSYGPVPISRTPLGEFFSGFFMGLVLLFLSVYIHVEPGTLLALKLTGWQLSLQLKLDELLWLLCLAAPAVSGIANIMLANNICDLEEDLANDRRTLPAYLGETGARRLFIALMGLPYPFVLILVATGVLPLWSLLLLAALPATSRWTRAFLAKPSKAHTFVYAVKHFVLLHLLLLLSLLLALWLPWSLKG